MALCSGVPIMQSFYQVMVRAGRSGRTITDPVLETGMFQMSKGITMRRVVPVSKGCRASFERAFCIPITTQLSIERYLDQQCLEWHSGSDDPVIEAPRYLFPFMGCAR